MATTRSTSTLAGARGNLAISDWPRDDPRYVAVIVHGYGEHVGRYEHVAQALSAHGATVSGPDHQGHGESDGERVLVEDFEDLLTDLDAVVERAGAAHPGLPVVLLGHSMGGLMAARYAQRAGDGLAALLLSAPVIGGHPGIEALLDLDPMPEVPIDPEALSRDPEVGRAYLADPLVWHGPFRRPTLQALFGAIADLAAGPSLCTLPTLWLQGEEDGLALLGPTRTAIERLAGVHLDAHVYPGARHEVLNETNREEVLADLEDFLDRVLTGAKAPS